LPRSAAGTVNYTYDNLYRLTNETIANDPHGIVGSSVSHGSVRQLTDALVTDTYDYDAFGNLIYRSGTTPNDYLYAGEQFGANLGFYYLRSVT